MFLLSPDKETLINVTRYAYIHACNKNITHIDFYLEPPVPGERGQPDVIFKYSSQEERNKKFDSLIINLIV